MHRGRHALLFSRTGVDELGEPPVLTSIKRHMVFEASKLSGFSDFRWACSSKHLRAVTEFIIRLHVAIVGSCVQLISTSVIMPVAM